MIRQSLKLVTAQTTWAVTLQEAKDQLRVDTSDEDTLIQNLIYAAQRQVEEYTNLDLTAATYDFYLTELPTEIVLPKSPVATLSSIKYYDANNAEQTWATANYFYNVQESPFIIRYTNSASTPTIYENRFDAVVVRFTTGYTSPDALPYPLKQAVLILITDMYETRGDTPRERFSNWQALCMPFRVWHSTLENSY